MVKRSEGNPGVPDRKKADGSAAGSGALTPEQRFEYIATAAYFKAAARNFTPGQEMDDWLKAEAEFDTREHARGSYQIADTVIGCIGEVFDTQAQAREALFRIVDEGTENEVNWLMELVQVVANGGSVNMDDDRYVRRILAAPENDLRKVAVECARERIYASHDILCSGPEPR